MHVCDGKTVRKRVLTKHQLIGVGTAEKESYPGTMRSVCPLARNLRSRCYNQQQLSSDRCAPHHSWRKATSITGSTASRVGSVARSRHDAADRVVKAAGDGSRKNGNDHDQLVPRELHCSHRQDEITISRFRNMRGKPAQRKKQKCWSSQKRKMP